MPNLSIEQPTRMPVSKIVARLLDDGGNVTITVLGANGTPIRSGSRIVDAYAYHFEKIARCGGRKEGGTTLCLVAEAVGAPDVEAALARLFEVASSDTGQSRIVARFLLAWWNGSTFGGFDLSNLFALDAALAEDMATVFTHLSKFSCAVYADVYGFDKEIRRLAERYLPAS